MLSREVVLKRFGHMPVNVAEAKNMVNILIAAMPSDDLARLIAKIKSTKKKNTKWFLFGIEVAELELTRRAS